MLPASLPGRGCRCKCRSARSRRRADGIQIPTPQAPSREVPPHTHNTPNLFLPFGFSHWTPMDETGVSILFASTLSPVGTGVRGPSRSPARIHGLFGLDDDGEALICGDTPTGSSCLSHARAGGDDGSGSSECTCGGVYLGPVLHPLASAKL